MCFGGWLHWAPEAEKLDLGGGSEGRAGFWAGTPPLEFYENLMAKGVRIGITKPTIMVGKTKAIHFFDDSGS